MPLSEVTQLKSALLTKVQNDIKKDVNRLAKLDGRIDAYRIRNEDVPESLMVAREALLSRLSGLWSRQHALMQQLLASLRV